MLITAAAAAESVAGPPVPLGNARCIDGRAVDGTLEPVLIRLPDGRAWLVAVASRDNAEILRRLEPVAALRAVIARNRPLADRLKLPAE